jgi:hypothetical protein
MLVKDRSKVQNCPSVRLLKFSIHVRYILSLLAFDRYQAIFSLIVIEMMPP